MKSLLLLTVILQSTFVFAMGADRDYTASIYGKRAEKIFRLMPKLTSNCGYVQAEKPGDLGPSINALVKNQDINSIICMQVGEITFACEASINLSSNPCNSK
jgi:hypothetical protein